MNQTDRVGEIGIRMGDFLVHAVVHEDWSIESAVNPGFGVRRARYFQMPSDHRDELALCVGVAIDVPLGCLDRPMPGQ